MKQTAVEWFAQKLSEQGIDYPLQEFEQAKQMDMEQKIDCFNQGYTQCSIEDLKPTSRERFLDAEDYINKTFKSEL